MPKSWEYCTVKFGVSPDFSIEVVYGTGTQKIQYTQYDDIEQMNVLNMLGSQGWEAISSSRYRGSYGANVSDTLMKVLMKREHP